MTPEEAHRFATSWCAAWNAHDLEGVLAHFREDAVFTSPIAAQILPDTGGRLVGREAIREYWQLGLQRIRDLRFEVVDVYTGVDTIVIHYRNQLGNLVNEVLRVDEDGLVVRGDGTYLVADAATASGSQPR